MDRSTLLDYINENLDVTQRRAVEQWRQAEPENEARFQALRKRWEQAPSPRARRAMYERIAFEDSPQKQRAVLWSSLAALTAVAVGLLAYFTLSQYAAAEEKPAVVQEAPLIFDDTPLPKVLRHLERRFSVDLQLEDPSLGNCRFTGKFEDLTLEEMLMMLEFTFSLDIEQTANNAYLLKGKGCR